MRRAFLILILLASPLAAAPSSKQLVADRAAAAKAAFDGSRIQLKVGRANVESVAAWSVRWLDAELAAGTPAKQVLADHLARMAALETELAKAAQSGTGSPFDHAAATYFRIEAELWVVVGKR